MDAENAHTNKGKKWTQEEVEQLKRLVNEKKTYEEIALEHKRTNMAIKARIVADIIYPFIKSGEMTIDEAAMIYNIDQYHIERYVNQKEARNDTSKDNNNNRQHTVVKFSNKDIMDKLDMIEKKIESIFTIMDNLIIQNE